MRNVMQMVVGWESKVARIRTVLFLAVVLSTACGLNDVGPAVEDIPEDVQAYSAGLNLGAQSTATPEAGARMATPFKQSMPAPEESCRALCAWICDPDPIPPPPSCCGDYPACWCQCIRQ